jgi:hypothetical protein
VGDLWDIGLIFVQCERDWERAEYVRSQFVDSELTPLVGTAKFQDQRQ